MILILGNSNDSLIYIENALRTPSKEIVELDGNVSYRKGKIYGQDVVIANTGYSSYRSSLVTQYLIKQFNPYIVLYLGEGTSLSPNLPVGSIFFGNYIKLIDVDMLFKDTSLHSHQLPGFAPYISVSENLITLLNDASSEVSVLNTFTGGIISASTFYKSAKDIPFNYKSLSQERKIELLFDSELGGVAFAGAFLQVPVLPIMIVSSTYEDEKSFVERKSVVLKNSVNVGKILIAFLVEITNDENNFIRSDEYSPDQRMKF